MGDCGMAADPCMGEAYLGPGCECICPPGTKGKLCQIKVGDYYGEAGIGKLWPLFVQFVKQVLK